MCDAKQDHPAMIQAARNLNEWAREKGITMRELAESTDVPYTLLWQAEKGVMPDRATATQLEALSRFFGRQLHEFFR